MTEEAVVKVVNLRKWFPVKKGFFKSLLTRKELFLRAVEGQMKIDIKKTAMTAAIVTGVLLIVNYIMSFIGYPVAQLYSAIGPVSAVSGTVGQKIVGWIGGIIPIEKLLGMGILYTFFSAIAILLAGEFMVDSMKLPSAKGNVGRLASIILYGTAVFYVLIVGLVMKSWNVIAGLAVHTIIVAYGTAFAADKLNVKI